MRAYANTIDIDFYVPVKDGEPFIAECIESILNQTLKPKRIVIYVNMHSTDRTLEIVRRYPVEIREVLVPLSDARNLAINELSTDWIGCCDADVILDPHWLEELWKHRNSGAVMISGNTQERIRSVGDLFRSITSPHNWGVANVNNPYMVVPDQIAQRKVLVHANGYKTSLVNYEDAELCLRLRKAGHKFYYVASAKAQHWRSDDFLSSMGLRWRHSFQRQRELLVSDAGLRKKFRNNISLATYTFCKSQALNSRRLEELCLLVPLHHLTLDILESQKSSAKLLLEPRNKSIQDRVVAVLSQFESAEWSQLWNEMAKFPDLAAINHFMADYNRFLTAATDPSHQPVEYCGPDSEWNVTLDRATVRASTASSILDFTNLPKFEINSVVDGESLADAGTIYFRQPWLPSSKRFWTCRDLTEFLALRDKDPVWTETFQGSTVICFTPRLTNSSMDYSVIADRINQNDGTSSS